MTKKNIDHQLCTVTLLGNLVSKPDIRYKANPISAITEIVLATNSKWLDKSTNKYKEWVSYHHIKVEGNLVEQALLNANKGDIILIHGYLSNIKPSDSKTSDTIHPAIIHATFVQKFSKGYTPSINHLYCSATLISTPLLMTTEHNKTLSQAKISINQHVYSIEKESWQSVIVERELHLWGKQAQYFVENATIGDNLVVEGKLSYSSNAGKSQFIDANKVHLLK